MKGNNMSVILVILLTLSGTLVFVPRALAQTPATAMEVVPVGANPGPPYPGRTLYHLLNGFNGSAGSTFTVSVWVINIAGLFSFGSGLYFNTTDLKVVAGSVVEGGFLSNHGANALSPSPIVISNALPLGMISCGWSLYNPALSASGSGPLFNATFQVLAGATPFTGSHAPGQGVLMGGLTLTPYGPAQTVLIYQDGYSIISPANSNMFNGTFLLSVTPTKPALSVTASPSPVTLDAGQSQLFTSNASGGTPPYSYQWYLNGSAVSGATHYAWTWTSSISGMYSVYVNVTDSASSRAKSNIASVTVQPLPSLSISPTSANIIIGNSQTFTSIISGGTSPYFYQWYLNGSAVSGAISSSWTFTPPSTGTYQIYAKITDAVNSATQSGNARLTVTPPPIIQVTISQTSSLMEVGQSDHFNSSVAGGKPPYTYQWYLNGAPVAEANSSTWTFISSSAGTYNVYLRATDFTGIVGESSNATLTVNLTPTAHVTPESVFLDIGESWTFMVSTSGGIPPFSYQWYIDGSPIINATGTTWTYQPFVLTNRTVYVVATDSFGFVCTSNQVSVYVGGVMNSSVSPASATMDTGQSQMYTATVSGGTPPYTYQWYQWFPNGSEPLAGATSSTFKFISTSSSIGFNVIYVEINDSVGVKVDCGAIAIVNPPPAAFISPASVIMDVGQSRQLTSIAVNGTPPYTYQWFIDDAPIAGATNNAWSMPMLEPVGVHEVYLIVTDSMGLAGRSNDATMIVNPSPTILVSPTSVTLDIGEPWTFVASEFNGTPPFSSYQWYIDGLPIIGATNYTWTYKPFILANRTVYVIATDSANFQCASNKVLVTVSSAMNPRISPTSATIDLGQSKQYVASVLGGTPPYSYQWYQWFPRGSKQFAGATNAALNFTPSSVGLNLIYVIITDSRGVSVDWGAKATVNPPLSVSISPKAIITDIGQSHTFSSIVVNGTQPYTTYQWYIDGTLVAYANASTLTYTPTLSTVGSHTICLAVIDSVNFTARSNVATIIVNPPLTVNILPASTVTDMGLVVPFTSITTGGMPPYSCQWYVNGAPVSGAVETAFTLNASSAGSYSVLLAVTDSFSFIVASNIAPVIVNLPPSVTVSPASPSIQLGEYQTFTATGTEGTTPYSYNWYVNGEMVAQTTTPTFSFTPPSISKYYTLYVTMTDARGLDATSNTAIINGHDVAVTEVVPVDNTNNDALKTVFGKGLPMGVEISVADIGYYSETFMVTAYLNTIATGSQNITLQSQGTALITLTGIANVAYGNYTISAYAWPVTGEVDTANNRLANNTRTILVTIPGDVNGDGYVNQQDLALICFYWHQLVPPAPANMDVNGDGYINIQDFSIACVHWHQMISL